MNVQTSRFGEIVVDPQEVINFNQGLPGFEEWKQYILVQTEDSGPFAYLQSTEWEELAFIVTDPFLFYPDYEFTVPETAKEELQLTDEHGVTVKALVTVTDELKQATINLVAPVLINEGTRTGKQLILNNTPYITKHPLIQETNAGTGRDDHARTDT